MTNSLTSKENASKQVRVFPRLTVTEAEAAIGAAVDGHDVTRVLWYQVERELKAGRLKVILEDFEPPPWPVNVIYPEARLSAAAEVCRVWIRERFRCGEGDRPHQKGCSACPKALMAGRARG
jgi:DNA-binding transcriptional LysR family regulator